jgi:hypothetical protein
MFVYEFYDLTQGRGTKAAAEDHRRGTANGIAFNQRHRERLLH